MDQLQSELDASHPELDIQIIGINEIGHESANAQMTAGRSLPWLQDLDTNTNQLSDIWREQWDIVYRDVIIVDTESTELGAFNLTTYDLADAGTYAALREILIDTAADQPFWENRDNSLDVNNDGLITAVGDVLPGINEINNRNLTDSSGQLPALRLPPIAGSPYLDVSGDGILTAQADLLPVINFINNQLDDGEGEFSAAPAIAALTGNTEDAVVAAATTTANIGVSVFPSWNPAAELAGPFIQAADQVGEASRLDPQPQVALVADFGDDLPALEREAFAERSRMIETHQGDDDLDELVAQLAVDVAGVWS